jgi:hypothetical protein
MKSSQKLIGFIAMVLFFIMATSIVFGQGTAKVVFGPKTYTRQTGTPVTVNDTFSVTNPAGQFTISIQNGDSKNTRVSSGSIVINNVEVVSESEFNKQAEKIEKAITGIQKNNTIKVTLRSKPGSFLIIKITGTSQYVQPTLIWQKDFGTEITGIPLSYPFKYVVTHDNVNFLDEGGNIKSTYQLEPVEERLKRYTQVMTSRDRIGITKITKLAGEDEENIKGELTILDSNGNKITTISNLNMGCLEFSPTGRALIDFGGGNKIDFYNGEGQFIKSVEIFNREAANFSFPGANDDTFSPDEDYFAFTLIEGVDEHAKAYVILYDTNYNEIWRQIVSNAFDGDYNLVSVSNKASFVAVSKRASNRTIESIEVYSKAGNLVWQYNLSSNYGVGYLGFSINNSYLVAWAGINDDDVIKFFEPATGNIIQQTPPMNGIQEVLGPTDEGNIFAVREPQKGNRELLLINTQGQVISLATFNNVNNNFSIQFSYDLKYLLVVNGNRVYSYSI